MLRFAILILLQKLFSSIFLSKLWHPRLSLIHIIVYFPFPLSLLPLGPTNSTRIGIEKSIFDLVALETLNRSYYVFILKIEILKGRRLTNFRQSRIREELFYFVHVDGQFSLCLTYFLFIEIKNIDFLLKVVKTVVNDVPLRADDHHSYLLIADGIFSSLSRVQLFFSIGVHDFNKESIHVFEVFGNVLETAADVEIEDLLGLGLLLEEEARIIHAPKLAAKDD